MSSNQNIYFASDFHLGSAADIDFTREKKVVAWLDSIKNDCAELYLLGDVFDFWFEYKYVVPKGHVRLLGKLAELADSGIPIHIFTGNHDVWMFDYFKKQFGAEIHTEPIDIERDGKRFRIGHGDALGPGDHGYKFIKKVFTNPLAQRCFAALHPRFGVALARFFSRKSRESTGHKDEIFLGKDEFLIQYCEEVIQSENIDYFIFGHRHLVIDHKLSNGSRYLNLGEWFKACNYAVFDGNELRMQSFNQTSSS